MEMAQGALAGREATQRLVVRDVLMNHCGGVLTLHKVGVITDELFQAMTTGSLAWAFGPISAGEAEGAAG